MPDPRQVALRRVSLFLDCVTLALSATVAFGVHALLQTRVPWLKAAPQPRDYTVVLYLAIPMWIVIEVLLGLHRLFEHRWTRSSLFVDLLKLHGLGFLSIAGLLFLSQNVMNRAIVLTFLLVNLALMFLLRSLIGATVEARWAQGLTRQALLLVGDDGPAISGFIAQATEEEFAPRIIGVLSAAEVASVPRLGAAADLEKVLHAEHVDRVVFFAPFDHLEPTDPLLRPCERVGVSTAFAVKGAGPYVLAPQVISVGNMPFLTFDWVPSRPEALAVKHAFDTVAAALLLIMAAPVLLLIALAVRLSMGPEVIFAQERVGLHGRRFRLYKFRTMVRGAEQQRVELLAKNEMGGPVFKLSDDPRTTPLGRFLRRWSLDELPQLLNVVLGQMSLVGPRPLPVLEQQEIQGWYRRRLTMKPGITGLWQVSGRSDTGFEEWMKMDLRYVEQWSLRLDLQLLQRTLPAVLSRRGAR